MKLPLRATEATLVDANDEIVATTISANGDYWLTDFSTDEANALHVAQIAHAVNHHDALVAALESAKRQLDRYEEELTGEVYNDPDLNALLAAAKGETDASN